MQRGVVDERKFEERTRESVSGYRTRIQELEKTVNDLALQLRTKAESEAELIVTTELSITLANLCVSRHS